MSWDPIWEDVFQESAWGKYPGEDIIRFVARHFYKHQDRSSVSLLEVGCGPGANLWFMAREGFTVIGIDGSETAISRSRQRLEMEVSGWRGRLIVGDIANLDLQNNSIDGVIDSEAIYANDFEVSLKIYDEIARVLKPGGMLLTRTFATGTVGEGTGQHVGHNAWIVDKGPLKGKGFSRFTHQDEIPKLLRSFDILAVDLVARTWNGLNSNQWVREFSVTAQKKLI